MDDYIDFVVTWVDPSDPIWANEFAQYKCDDKVDENAPIDSNSARYRDWGLLKYWFRGVEKFAPWVRYIHFVTYGHVPSWLDVNNPKIRIVRHEDFIPKEFLPLFNSNPIELMMHRIPDLAEHFVYFNDDFYLVRPVSRDYFFHRGKPCEIAVAKNHHTMDGVMLGIIEHDMEILNNEYNLFTSLFMHPRIWFNLKYKGFLKLTFNAIKSKKILSLLDSHAPAPYLKSTFEEVWSKYQTPLIETMTHRFRSAEDVSHWLFRYWQIVKGCIEPRNLFESTKIFYQPSKSIDSVVRSIEYGKYSVMVINDSSDIDDIDSVIARISTAFNDILPGKSSFEK